MRFVVTLGGEAIPVEVREADGRYHVRLGEEWLEVDARIPPAGPVSLLVEGRPYLVDLAPESQELVVTVGGAAFRLRVEEAERRRATTGRPVGGGAQRLVAPMPGRVVTVHVRPGDRVGAGAPLVVLEAMKMENEFRATGSGVVTEVRVSPGQAVNAGELLVVVSPEDEAPAA